MRIKTDFLNFLSVIALMAATLNYCNTTGICSKDQVILLIKANARIAG